MPSDWQKQIRPVFQLQALDARDRGRTKTSGVDGPDLGQDCSLHCRSRAGEHKNHHDNKENMAGVATEQSEH
jgi:hypothetical protein